MLNVTHKIKHLPVLLRTQNNSIQDNPRVGRIHRSSVYKNPEQNVALTNQQQHLEQPSNTDSGYGVSYRHGQWIQDSDYKGGGGGKENEGRQRSS
jgi:hypothetical protein